ncbi:MAG: phosphopantothenoylcysteine decarboxylase [Bacteroidota bacterium]|nr:phosphopantothenoylcysteine decarboxylase [Bacteroidota bacterium]
MINIAITAGGTSESMDGVREITNISTGSLGWHCLEAVLSKFSTPSVADFHVHYIHTRNAIIKGLAENDKKKVSFIPVTDAESVFQAVDKLTKEVALDYFIHSMAISDFTFSYSVSHTGLAREIEALQHPDGFTGEEVRSVLENPRSKHSTGEKILSDEDILIGLKRTKKVIPLIKKNNPNTFLVGFKLLANVDETELLRVANELAEKNRCDLVVANDVSAIGETNHQAILVKEKQIIARAVGKSEIAKLIIDSMLKN